MVEAKNYLFVTDAADEIAAAQRLIEAGVNSGDQELIEAGIKRWSNVWPNDIVRAHTALYIEDLQAELER